MEIALQNATGAGFIEKIKSIADLCRISNIEKFFSYCLEEIPDTSPVNYIGELNKNDIML